MRIAVLYLIVLVMGQSCAQSSKCKKARFAYESFMNAGDFNLANAELETLIECDSQDVTLLEEKVTLDISIGDYKKALI